MGVLPVRPAREPNGNGPFGPSSTHKPILLRDRVVVRLGGPADRILATKTNRGGVTRTAGATGTDTHLLSQVGSPCYVVRHAACALLVVST